MAYLVTGVTWAALSVSAFVLPACGGITDLSTELAPGASGGSTSAYSRTGGSATVTVGTVSIATGGAANSGGMSTVSDSGYNQLQSQACEGFSSAFSYQTSCGYAMSPMYICGGINFPSLDEVSVFLTTAQNVHYLVDNTNGTCVNGEGYYLSDTGNSITLCGSLCDALHSGKFAELEVFVHCPATPPCIY
jgi:hypothetical protein